jgi:hypothetical protein
MGTGSVIIELWSPDVRIRRGLTLFRIQIHQYSTPYHCSKWVEGAQHHAQRESGKSCHQMAPCSLINYHYAVIGRGLWDARISPCSSQAPGYGKGMFFRLVPAS